ncbi:MAG: DUF937 domain-containing protein [Gemmatimonadaceae bacterium]|nr:DUF937 domain-containing protein [Gemmatimonadaceae bacterium]
MGLLDGALGQVAGSLLGGQGGDTQQIVGGLLKQFGGQGSANGLLAAAITLVQQNGGIEGLVQKFQSGGLGDVVQSWVGTGANTAVSGAQLERVLGADSVASVASQAGVSPSEASNGLAAVLPELVNQLTPGGSIPTNSGDLVKSVLGMLRG